MWSWYKAGPARLHGVFWVTFDHCNLLPVVYGNELCDCWPALAGTGRLSAKGARGEGRQQHTDRQYLRVERSLDTTRQDTAGRLVDRLYS